MVFRCLFRIHKDQKIVTRTDEDGCPFYENRCLLCGRVTKEYQNHSEKRNVLDNKKYPVIVRVPYNDNCTCHPDYRLRNLDGTCPKCRSTNVKIMHHGSVNQCSIFGFVITTKQPAVCLCLDCQASYQVSLQEQYRYEHVIGLQSIKEFI